MTAEFKDESGAERLRGSLLIGGTTGQVATVQADGTIGPETGGAQPNGVTLLGPSRVNFNSANFMNPSDNGFLTSIDVPLGSLVEAFAVTVTSWVGVQAGDELLLQLAAAVGSSGPSLADYDGNNLTDPFAVAYTEPTMLAAGLTANGSRRALARAASHVYALFLSGGVVTAGAIDVYAYVSEPL